MTNIDSVGVPAVPPAPAAPAPKVEISVTFETPGLDPVNHPDATNGSPTQNQYTYSAGKPGKLRVLLRAKVSPPGNAADAAKRIRFEVNSIPGSELQWEGKKGGKPTRIHGDFVETLATFRKLPKENASFGSKKARLLLDGALVEEREFLVFFPRGAKNHPGKPAGAPNWFYYWKQVAKDKAGVAEPMVFGGPKGNLMGCIKGMLKWSYNAYRPKRTIFIYSAALSKTRSYGIGIELSGIDCFIGTAIHEAKHVDQIRRADALVPSVRCWRFGYSWNQAVQNHWRSGRPDGLWGNPPIATNKVNVKPPLQIGQGADVWLDDPSWTMWPAAWPLPPVINIHPIEQEAIDESDMLMGADHTYARDDWADPGKNHLTVDNWDD